MSFYLLKHKSSQKLLLLIILIFTLFLFFGVKDYGFVNWDDDENIGKTKSFTELTTKNIHFHYFQHRFKALAIWSFMLEYQMFGYKPKYYHLNNLFLHLVNIVLVFVFIKKLTPKNRLVPILTSLFFAIHPSFVEPIVWITGRKDLLFVLFSLASFITYFNFLKQKKWYLQAISFALVAIFIYLSSLSKIQAITLPFVLIAIDWLQNRKFSILSFIEKIILLFLIIDMFYIAFSILCLSLLIKYHKLIIRFIKKNTFVKILSSIILIFLLFKYKGNIGESVKNYLGFDWINIVSDIFLFVLYALLLAYLFSKKIQEKFSKQTKNSFLKNRHFLYVLVAVTAILFFIFNYSYLHKYFPRYWTIDKGDTNFYSIFERILLLSSSLVFYLKRFFLISSQNPMIPYPERLENGQLPNYLIFDFIIILIISAVVLFILLRYFRKTPLTWFGIIFFLINIGIVLHIIPIEGRVLVADRYTYLAYIGLFLIISLIIEYLIHKKHKIFVISIVVLSVFIMSFTSYKDKNTWQNSFTLWQKALKVDSKNHYAMFSLALAYFSEANDIQKAEELLTKAILLKEDFMYFNNRGRLFYAQGNYNKAIDDFNKSILLDSTSYAAFNNRGACYQQYCNYLQALTDYRKAIEIEPNYLEALNNEKKVLDLMHYDSLLFGKITKKELNEDEILNFLFTQTEKMQNTEQKQLAISYYQQALKIIPDNYEIYENLALIYHANDDFTEAKQIYNFALEKFGNNQSLLLGRGLLYIQTGDTIKACQDLNLSSQLGNKEAKILLEEFCN